MASLVYNFDVQIDDPNNVYGQVVAPEVTVGGGMALQARMGDKSMAGVRFDRDLACLMLVPTDTPADTTLTDTVTSGGTWKEVVSPHSGKVCVCQMAAPAVANTDDETHDYTYTPAGDGTTPLIADGQGLYLDLGRSAPVAGTSSKIYVMATFNNSDETQWYRIVWAYGEPPRVEASADGIAWVRQGDIPVNDGGAIRSGRPAVLRLHIMRANGYVAFRSSVNNAVSESACVVPDFEPVKPFVISGRNCNLSIAWRPMTFTATGTFTSPVFQKTFNNTGLPVAIAEGQPYNDTDATIDGVTMDAVDTGSDWTAQYTMEVTAQDSGLTTPYVWSAGLRFPADTVEPGTPAWVSVDSSTDYQLAAEFAPDALTVHRGGSVSGTNQYAEFGTAYGMRAVRVLMTVGVLNEASGVVTWFDPFVRFVGWLNLNSATTETVWQSALTERGDYELGVPLLDNVILDGDCMYHAVKILCQRGGFTRGWFEDGVPGNPSDAWDCDGITCDPGAGHIRLGRGFDENPLWEFRAGEMIRQCIARIQGEYLMYFGIGGTGTVFFYPWDFTGVRAAWTPRQIFSYVPAFTSGVPNLNEFTGQITKRVDLSQVRNSVTLVGLERYTEKILVSHQLDMASIATSSYPTTPINFMGRVRPYFNSDARYATPEIADAVAARKFALFRVPIESYDPLEVIPQPLNPLDYIGIAATRAMPRDEEFYIGSVREAMGVVEGPQGAARVDGTMLLSAIVVPDV